MVTLPLRSAFFNSVFRCLTVKFAGGLRSDIWQRSREDEPGEDEEAEEKVHILLQQRVGPELMRP